MYQKYRIHSHLAVLLAFNIYNKLSRYCQVKSSPLRSQTEKILSGLVQEISKLYPTLSELDQTRSGIAAFVSGVYSTGMSPTIIDYYTINYDFSADVLTRAKYFSENNVL